MMNANKGQYRDIGKEIARELKAEDFGTPEEIAEKARPMRMAKSRAEAKHILEEIASKGPLTSADGVEATISSKSKKEMLSGKSSHNSFEIEAHWQAVVNIDKYYRNAIEKQPIGLDPYKGNKNLEARKFLYSPMEYQGRIVPIKFTILEYKRDKNLRLYDIEAINVELR
jgi:hypothetical protein